MAGQALSTHGKHTIGLLPGGDIHLQQGAKELTLDPDTVRWLLVAGLPAALAAHARGEFPALTPEGQIAGQIAIAA